MKKQLQRGALIAVGLVCLSCSTSSPTRSRGDDVLRLASSTDALSTRAKVADQVVVVSVDGLGAVYMAPMMEKGLLPGFARLAAEGAWTHDARTDPYNTTTLPSHVGMITGLPTGPMAAPNSEAYHGFSFNRDPLPGMTIHNSGNRHRPYIPSMFDVAHDRGLSTCLFSGKSKFTLFDRSYDGNHGAPDRIGADNGRDKLDKVVIEPDITKLYEAWRSVFEARGCALALFHIADPDVAGHRHGWGSEGWRAAVRQADRIVERIFAVASGVRKTALIVTADHGGHGTSHADVDLEANFTIPFYLVAEGVPGNQDLYRVFSKTRGKTPHRNPSFHVALQPIRNGDAGNLALSLLGLPPIPGSLIFGMRDPG